MQLDQHFLENAIRRMIAEELGGDGSGRVHSDCSGVLAIDPKGVKLEKFPFPIESDRVWLRDLMTLEESPRLGLGMMELDHTRFEWTLAYDEIDYVLEGTLEILVDNRAVAAKSGQLIFIPKGSKIQFSTPDRTRFLYICYPADWAEQ